MTVAITGGTGFVGQAVLDIAAVYGVKVRALARTIPKDRPIVDWITGSLFDEEAVANLVHNCDAIIHIAGLTNTPDPAQFDVVNVDGTRAIVEAAKAAGVTRFIFVSSLAAREPDLSRYGASKARAEALVQQSG
ncbi:MAG: NAD(P)H-binding protein, partial [Pontixanthobacter sp.]